MWSVAVYIADLDALGLSRSANCTVKGSPHRDFKSPPDGRFVRDSVFDWMKKNILIYWKWMEPWKKTSTAGIGASEIYLVTEMGFEPTPRKDRFHASLTQVWQIWHGMTEITLLTADQIKYLEEVAEISDFNYSNFAKEDFNKYLVVTIISITLFLVMKGTRTMFQI